MFNVFANAEWLSFLRQDFSQEKKHAGVLISLSLENKAAAFKTILLKSPQNSVILYFRGFFDFLFSLLHDPWEQD